MRKKFGLIAALIIGTTTSLQVSACTDDSKYQEFIGDVNSGHAFSASLVLLIIHFLSKLLTVYTQCKSKIIMYQVNEITD